MAKSGGIPSHTWPWSSILALEWAFQLFFFLFELVNGKPLLFFHVNQLIQSSRIHWWWPEGSLTTFFGATGPKQALLALSEHNLINFGSFPIFCPLSKLPFQFNAVFLSFMWMTSYLIWPVLQCVCLSVCLMKLTMPELILFTKQYRCIHHCCSGSVYKYNGYFTRFQLEINFYRFQFFSNLKT